MTRPSDSSQPRARTGSHLFPAGQLVPFILVTGLFFLWGIPNNLNDVLIRHFMKSFAISRFQAGLVQSAFYMGYFLLAMPAALLMRRVGYKSGFVTGLVLFGAGAFLFWPAALAGSYGFFLFALFVIASGLSFLETASNPFMSLAAMLSRRYSGATLKAVTCPCQFSPCPSTLPITRYKQ